VKGNAVRENDNYTFFMQDPKDNEIHGRGASQIAPSFFGALCLPKEQSVISTFDHSARL
jgi:hypothetical protein